MENGSLEVSEATYTVYPGIYKKNHNVIIAFEENLLVCNSCKYLNDEYNLAG